MAHHIALYTILLLWLRPASNTKWLIENPGFDSLDAWISNELPCSQEDVVFPESYAVLPLPKDIAINGFILPRSGALVVSQDSVISFGGDEKTHKCESGKTRKAYLKAPSTRKWFDPRSWRSQETHNNALPLMEQVPCNNETVIIKGGPLSIDLENVPFMRMGELNLAGTPISKAYLQQLISNSDIGSILFQNSVDVAVEFYRKDVCGCHKDIEKFVPPICDNVKSTCQKPHCLTPIMPLESCGCGMCGAVLRFAVDRCDNANFQKLNQLIARSIVADDLGDVLDYHVSYINTMESGDFLQAIVVDRNEYKEKSVDFVTRLNASTNWKSLFATSPRLQVAVSGRPYNPNITFGSVLLILGCLLLVGAVALIILMHYAPERYLRHLPRRWRTAPFMFARFDNMPIIQRGAARGSAVESIIMGYDNESGEVRNRTQQAFDNPLFDETPTSAAKIEDVDNEETTPMEPTSFEGLEDVPLTVSTSLADASASCEEQELTNLN